MAPFWLKIKSIFESTAVILLIMGLCLRIRLPLLPSDNCQSLLCLQPQEDGAGMLRAFSTNLQAPAADAFTMQKLPPTAGANAEGLQQMGLPPLWHLCSACPIPNCKRRYSSLNISLPPTSY